MCHEVTCKRCGKPGWVGCGQHVEMVLGHVLVEDRCSCAQDRPRRRWFSRS